VLLRRLCAHAAAPRTAILSMIDFAAPAGILRGSGGVPDSRHGCPTQNGAELPDTGVQMDALVGARPALRSGSAAMLARPSPAA